MLVNFLKKGFIKLLLFLSLPVGLILLGIIYILILVDKKRVVLVLVMLLLLIVMVIFYVVCKAITLLESIFASC
ncbi:hypothetical protein DXN04_34070 [Chitinophaga silvisoli]|uniref:Uncharacterized protein n=1 Tax=Chitinophaga silvisoli TaxID=2291814 RepID=A0A3E1NKH1_9BACT|nr:hypothetical protein DXN04_34070 [Chitinophaga silvisoli]